MRTGVNRGVAALATTLALSGCTPGPVAPSDGIATAPAGRACTQIGCQDGLVVRVLPAEAWPPGQYQFDIGQDGARVACTGTLPLPPCGGQAMVCDAREPLIVESGCALEPAAHAFGAVIFSTTPAEVAVVVTHDGKRVGAGHWRPVYQTSQPNGPGCEPVCTNAVVELELSFGSFAAAVGNAHAASGPVMPQSLRWFSDYGDGQEHTTRELRECVTREERTMAFLERPL